MIVFSRTEDGGKFMRGAKNAKPPDPALNVHPIHSFYQIALRFSRIFALHIMIWPQA